MFKLLKIIAGAGEATTRYPFAPYPVSPGFRGKPQLRAELCIACASCTMACPPNALSMRTDTASGERTWQLDVGRCIFCGRCQEVCPTNAVALTEEFELAVGNKADLLQTATFRLENCSCCGEPFAPEREVSYVMDLLIQSGVEVTVEQRKLFATCLACKRKHTVTRDNVYRKDYQRSHQPRGVAR